jgi:hypothetical protein
MLKKINYVSLKKYLRIKIKTDKEIIIKEYLNDIVK